MGSLLTCTGASCWPNTSVACRAVHVMGGATDHRFSLSYSESSVLSLNFHLDRERPCFPSTANLAAPSGQTGPTPAPNSSEAHSPAVYANCYGAQDAGFFGADWCSCFSVCGLVLVLLWYGRTTRPAGGKYVFFY